MPRPKSRREQYSDATHAALLETATEMFAEHGFAGTTLADVAAATQVTRGAVYHHFENKKALFHAVLESLESDVARLSREAYDDSDDVMQGAFAALAQFLEQSCAPVYSEVVWRQGPIALGWHEWKLCEEKFAYGLIEEILTALVTSGRIVEVPIDTTTRIIFSMLGGTGMALADAPDAEKPRVKQECLEVMGRFIAGLVDSDT